MAERGLDRIERRFVTPEGVDLRLRLANAGQRFSAFAIDALILIVSMILFTITLGLVLAAFGFRGAEYGAIVWLLIFFFARNGYFIAFELGERAATPGKRLLGMRVIARGDGRLTGDAVIARNLMRELEIFLPLSFLGYQADQGLGDALTAIVGLCWAALFALFPLFNRDRLRAGDLIAGTWVIQVPRQDIGSNLLAENQARSQAIVFRDDQLAAYGVFELQTLEKVLRAGDIDTIAAVAHTIREKIGWIANEHDVDFLGAYYNALRGRLERGLLFGKRRVDKYDRG